jgi:hypothetical protein
MIIVKNGRPTAILRGKVSGVNGIAASVYTLI